MSKKQKKVLYRIIISAVLVVVFSLIPESILKEESVIRFLLFMIPYLVIGYDILKKALSLIHI